jgi:hypothetical protein
MSSHSQKSLLRLLPISIFILVKALLQVSHATELTMEGRKQVQAVTRDGKHLLLGHVQFTRDTAGVTHFKLTMDSPLFVDHFLSMKEFKCIDGATEVSCHVPYPYRNPQTITANNFAWLEHSLLFLFKQPRDFGAKLWNGSYYQFQLEGKRLVGRAQAIDLNHISAPSDTPDLPPYTPDLRTDAAPSARWIDRLVIE